MEGDLGHAHDEDTEDWVSQTSSHYVALMAQQRGRIKDTGCTSDDDESTTSDVESKDELTERDDKSRRQYINLLESECNLKVHEGYSSRNYG